ncbi:high affinity immunoglobulin epsilon receptor subunit alpha isoform X1 [Physeter macrocephalus]|uniref:high affinity immunoglobulin epsilon receptor subunit alpha isoform X1 n=1 Tax=Physeter macrocephalus TaxID=9755 RepID=UPI00042C319A|nr:high affinity immunoglobulin epsilon receptor subunit alpha isoform X1 [Physeter catodon]|eukprot:XP_007105273.1 high affinity immunoglobulin epsilon receptor subunit alpha [Physeter catodon]
MSTAMGTPALLWIALLLFSPDGISAAIWKSKVSLNPPWNRVFRGENVTLTCRGNNFLENDSILWTHNKNPLEVNTSRWDIMNASIQDSGEYRCQSKGVSMSEPVYLYVISDWLLLQASAEMVLEGEHLFLRCHGWRNLNVYKVTYFKNDKAFKYWYENHNISITSATTGDSGTYYCMGTIQKIRYTSNHLSIEIKKGPQSKYFWLQFLIPLLVKILFVVDTALFISTQQQFTFLLKIKRTRKGNKFMDPEPRPEPPKN